MRYFLGIDIGTSSTKAVLMARDGTVVHTCAPAYDFVTPRPLWAESNPADWWVATQAACREMVAKAGGAANIAAVGLTGQMHGLVLLDAAGQVLRPCIMWNDQRTAAQCAAITARVGAARVLQLTGNPVLPGFTAGKVVWVRENEPDIYARAAKILLPKDYIRYLLSGEYFSEVSDASGTSLLDVARRTWSDEMLEGCGIPRSWLPELTESTVASTKVSASAAATTGLLAGTPIIAGGGDQAAQAVGCGIVKEGIISATLGTSGVVFAHSDRYRVEPQGRLHAFCHAVPGKWHLMGVMLSAAGSYAWYRDNLASGVSYNDLNAEAATVLPGSEGLYFLPYLSGERTPHPDPLARGAFVGLTLRHRRAHLTRAVLEGVTYGMRDSLELMRDLGISPSTVIASGGGAASPFWRQMQADIYGATIQTVNATEGAAFGAAVLAGVGVGAYSSVEAACSETLKVTSEVKQGANASRYASLYPGYRSLYPALKAEFAAISRAE
ncbi:MAG: xylulokinase [Verrucomicrobiota bacterium]|nr:xylulokinase [Verrucomicrobiota bacterium]